METLLRQATRRRKSSSESGRFLELLNRVTQTPSPEAAREFVNAVRTILHDSSIPAKQKILALEALEAIGLRSVDVTERVSADSQLCVNLAALAACCSCSHPVRTIKTRIPPCFRSGGSAKDAAALSRAASCLISQWVQKLRDQSPPAWLKFCGMDISERSVAPSQHTSTPIVAASPPPSSPTDFSLLVNNAKNAANNAKAVIDAATESSVIAGVEAELTRMHEALGTAMAEVANEDNFATFDELQKAQSEVETRLSQCREWTTQQQPQPQQQAQQPPPVKQQPKRRKPTSSSSSASAVLPPESFNEFLKDPPDDPFVEEPPAAAAAAAAFAPPPAWSVQFPADLWQSETPSSPPPYSQPPPQPTPPTASPPSQNNNQCINSSDRLTRSPERGGANDEVMELRREVQELRESLQRAKEMWLRESARASSLLEALDEMRAHEAAKEERYAALARRHNDASRELCALKQLVQMGPPARPAAAAAPAPVTLNREENRSKPLGARRAQLLTVSTNATVLSADENSENQPPPSIGPSSRHAVPAGLLGPASLLSPAAESSLNSYRDLLTTDDAVLFQDRAIQIGVKIRRRGLTATADIYYGNMTVTPLVGFHVEIATPEWLAVSASAVPPILNAKQQVIQSVAASCSEPYSRVPSLVVKYLLADNSPVLLRLPLPLPVTKFMGGETLPFEEYERLWQQFALNEAYAAFSPDPSRYQNSILHFVKALQLGGALRFLPGYDAGEGVVVILVGTFPPGGCDIAVPVSVVILRFETTKNGNRCRLRVRSDSGTLAKAVRDVAQSLLAQPTTDCVPQLVGTI